MKNQIASNGLASGLKRAVVLGGLTGIRSTAGLRHVHKKNDAVRLLVFAESVADKLPFIPARTQAASLFARAGLSGYAASRLAKEKQEKLKYAAIGALSALACTFVVTKLRTRFGAKSHLRSALLGLAEDGVVSWAGRSLSAA